MTPVLLDTHVLLWWYLDDPQLPQAMALKLAEAEKKSGFALSVISLWEIAKLVEVKRVHPEFSLDEWFDELEADPKIWLIPLDAHIVLESTRLGPSFHRDPADQLIAATARCKNLRLLTADERIRRSSVVALV